MKKDSQADSKTIDKQNTFENLLCESDPEVVAKEYVDTVIGGVTYRVWSAFEDKIDIEQSLGELMLRQLESEDEAEKAQEMALG